MSDLTFSRRRVFALCGASAFAGLPLPALALTGSEAENLVTRAVGEINQVIASGAPLNSMISGFNTIFQRYADTAYLAAYALGNDGRSATNAQKAAFADAFGVYLANKYGRRFNEFADGVLQVQGSRAVNSYIEVQTMANLRNQSPIRVDFHVSDRPGRPVFFNLIVEGVNMLLSERVEIGAMLDQRGGDIDALIRDMT